MKRTLRVLICLLMASAMIGSFAACSSCTGDNSDPADTQQTETAEASQDTESQKTETQETEPRETEAQETEAQETKAQETESSEAQSLMSGVLDEIGSLSAADFKEADQKTEYVKITVKDHGDMILRLRADVAPATVENFQNLVADGFYDGLTFHRIYKNFMIQGGDPKGDGTGRSDVAIKGEFLDNDFSNNLKHVRGVISMARGEDKDSATCQFFICHGKASHLDNKYATFGYVVAGLDTLDAIASVEVQASAGYKGEKSDPVQDVIIEKMVFVEKNTNA